MYKNLEREMIRKNISRNVLAEFLGVKNATICDKINGKFSFKLNEALKIKTYFFPELTLEYLFEISE